MERKTRNLDQVKCLKDEKGKVLVKEQDIKDRWETYFHKLLDESVAILSCSNELSSRKVDQNYTFYRIIQHDVKEALRRMDNGWARQYRC